MDEIKYPGYTSLSLTTICGSIQMVMLIALIKKTKSKLPSRSLYIAYSSIICYFLYCFSTIIISIYAVSITEIQFSALLCTFRYLSEGFIVAAKTLMLLFYVSRLHKIFKGTSMEFNDKYLSLKLFALFIIIGFSIPGILFDIVAITGFTRADQQSISDVQRWSDCSVMIKENAMNLAPIAITINLLVDLIVSIILLRLYLKKMVILSSLYDDKTDTIFNDNANKDGRKFMKLTLKITNLMIISVVTEYMMLVINAIQIGVYWFSINTTINVLCIYLNFGSSNDKLYNKLCCFVDKCCYHCCKRLCFCCFLPKTTGDIKIAVVLNQANSMSKSSSNASSQEVTTSTNNSTNVQVDTPDFAMHMQVASASN